MAFISKKDYCGFSRTGVLEVAGDTQGASSSDVTANDDLGDVVAFTTVSGGESPTNDYDIKADVAFTGANVIKFGVVNEVGTKKYMATSVSFTTSAGAVPTFSATATDVESSATTGDYIAVPEFTLPKKHKAELVFEEATIGGTGCYPITCSYTIGGTVNVDRDELGVPTSSGISGFTIVNSVTIQQSGTAVPTVTPAEGWHASVLTQTNGKGTYPTWTVTLTKYLAKTEV